MFYRKHFPMHPVREKSGIPPTRWQDLAQFISASWRKAHVAFEAIEADRSRAVVPSRVAVHPNASPGKQALNYAINNVETMTYDCRMNPNPSDSQPTIASRAESMIGIPCDYVWLSDTRPCASFRRQFRDSRARHDWLGISTASNDFDVTT
jgi:hypothetical protein